MLVLAPFSGMHKENCLEALNELSGQCWPQYQLTQLLIMALEQRMGGACVTRNASALLRHAVGHAHIHTH